MNEKTQKLTLGALLVAVFGVLLILNRQTGGMLEETFIFLFPIPMVAFSARYGWKDSIPVFICTVLISFFCGILSSAFYAVTQSFIGVVYGSCLHAKKDANKTMLLVMALSAVSNLLSTVVLASLFGIDLEEDIRLMQDSMQQMLKQLGTNMTEAQMQSFNMLMQPDVLLRMLIVSMIFMGAVQGLIVCQLSLIILRRLRFPIQKPAPISSYYPPRWTGIVAAVAFFYYGTAVSTPQREGLREIARVLMQMTGLCGYMYLLFFGFIGILFLLRAYGPSSRLINAVLAILFCFMIPQITTLIGVAYVSLGMHDWVVNKMTVRMERDEKMRAGRRRSPRSGQRYPASKNRYTGQNGQNEDHRSADAENGSRKTADYVNRDAAGNERNAGRQERPVVKSRYVTTGNTGQKIREMMERIDAPDPQDMPEASDALQEPGRPEASDGVQGSADDAGLHGFTAPETVCAPQEPGRPEASDGVQESADNGALPGNSDVAGLQGPAAPEAAGAPHGNADVV